MDPQTISYSELDTFRQCPLKHLWSYRERWTKEQDEGGPLAKGTLWHTVMEEHYLKISEWQQRYRTRRWVIPERMWAAVLADCREAVQPYLADPKSGEQTENQALIQWMYEGYVEQYGIDPQWRILGVEMRAELPLYDPQDVAMIGDSRRKRTDRPVAFRIKAKLDLLVQDLNTGHRWIIDHKSGANLPTQFDLELDDQFGLYTWLMRESGTPVLGAIHSAARTTRNLGDYDPPPKGKKPQTLDQRMHRTYLNRSDHELTAIAIDAYNAAVNMYPEAVGFFALPLYSSPDPRSCGWKCDFKEVHLLARAGRDVDEVLVDYGFEQNFERH